MINDKRAHEVTKQLATILEADDMTDFLVIVPFSNDDDGLAFIAASAASAPSHNSMTVSATLKTAIQNLMRFNGLTVGAAAGALHAMVDDAAEETAEEMHNAVANPTDAWGKSIPSA